MFFSFQERVDFEQGVRAVAASTPYVRRCRWELYCITVDANTAQRGSYGSGYLVLPVFGPLCGLQALGGRDPTPSQHRLRICSADTRVNQLCRSFAQWVKPYTYHTGTKTIGG